MIKNSIILHFFIFLALANNNAQAMNRAKNNLSRGAYCTLALTLGTGIGIGFSLACYHEHMKKTESFYNEKPEVGLLVKEFLKKQLHDGGLFDQKSLKIIRDSDKTWDYWRALKTPNYDCIIISADAERVIEGCLIEKGGTVTFGNKNNEIVSSITSDQCLQEVAAIMHHEASHIVHRDGYNKAMFQGIIGSLLGSTLMYITFSRLFAGKNLLPTQIPYLNKTINFINNGFS